jgi:hypothetical protein
VDLFMMLWRLEKKRRLCYLLGRRFPFLFYSCFDYHYVRQSFCNVFLHGIHFEAVGLHSWLLDHSTSNDAFYTVIRLGYRTTTFYIIRDGGRVATGG